MTQYHEEQLEALTGAVWMHPGGLPWPLPRMASLKQVTILVYIFVLQVVIMSVAAILRICSHRVAIAARIYKRYFNLTAHQYAQN